MAKERFSYTGDHKRNTGVWIAAAVWLAIALAFLFGLRYFGTYAISQQQESLENALRRDVAQCYALEGVYPPSLDYLKEHYGLTYDPDTFFVDYRPIGSNMYPDITVVLLAR